MKKILVLACLFLCIQTTKVFSQEHKEKEDLTEEQKTQIKSEITNIVDQISLTSENCKDIPKIIESLNKYCSKHTLFYLPDGNKINATELGNLISTGKLKVDSYTSSENEFDYLSPKLVIFSRKINITGSMNNVPFNSNLLIKSTFHHYMDGWKLLSRQPIKLK
ncbi:MAG: hypothetical protein QM539_02725 [Alphaproteobacteria bacterium]|nr:hypothetical protein [Alphaproteobacteria bacterium]